MLLNVGTCEQDCARGIPGHRWQHEATEAVHSHLFSTTICHVSLRQNKQALIRSQGGPDRGPLHLFPCEPGVQDRLFFVQGVAVASLASFASFLP